jgi:hypothetical protein
MAIQHLLGGHSFFVSTIGVPYQATLSGKNSANSSS